MTVFSPSMVKQKSSGFGLIETVVGAAIISVVLFGLAEVGQFAFRTADESNLRLRAAFLAEEGIEAVKTMRDAGWAANIAPLNLNQDYYLQFLGNAWRLDALPQPLVDGLFDRRVVFREVERNASDDIVAGGGAADSSSRKVTVTVTANIRGRTISASIATYLTDLFDN